jgi:hypothetical protein
MCDNHGWFYRYRFGSYHAEIIVENYGHLCWLGAIRMTDIFLRVVRVKNIFSKSID